MMPRNMLEPPSSGSDRARDFGIRLRTWRRLNDIKQAALAQMMGVSQTAVARWESGLDMPAPARIARLRSLMAESLRDQLLLERLFIRRQSGMRALFDYDGMRLIEVSEGFRRIWPDFSLLTDIPMADSLVNEARYLVERVDTHRSILNGALGIVSGVSTRHIDLLVDAAVPHAWHVCFRRHGAHVLGDIVFEPCVDDRPTGITDLVYIDSV